MTFNFYQEKLLDLIVFKLIHHNYYLFKCASEQMYLTAANTVSNLSFCSSTADGAQIISKYALLRTSALL